MQSGHVFWGILSCLSHQTLLLLFQACQVQLSNVSGMNRQRPISFPFSSSLLHAIIPLLSLTSPMTDCSQHFLSSLDSHYPSFTPPLVFWRLSARRLCQWSEECKKPIPAACCRISFPFSPVSSFEVRFLKSWMSYEQHWLSSACFTVLLFAVFHS